MLLDCLLKNSKINSSYAMKVSATVNPKVGTSPRLSKESNCMQE